MFFNVLVQESENTEVAQITEACSAEQAILTAKGEDSSFKLREGERWESCYILASSAGIAYDVLWGESSAGGKMIWIEEGGTQCEKEV